MRRRLWLGAVSALNLATYFLFQFFVIKRLGPGMETDAFIASSTIPQLVIAVIGGSIGYVLVPVLSTGPRDRLKHDAWTFVYVMAVLFFALALLLHLSGPIWIPSTVPGFGSAQRALVAELVTLQLLSMPVSAMIAVQLAAHAAQDHFVRAEALQCGANVVAIGMLAVAMPVYGVHGAAWVALARLSMQSLALVFGMGWPPRPRQVRDLVALPLQRIRPLLLGSAYYRTEPAVDRYLLSKANSGALTLYYLVDQVYSGVSQLLNKTLTAPTVPHLSVLFDRHDLEGFAALYRTTVLRVLACSVVLVVSMVAAVAFLLPMVAPWLGASAGQWADLWRVMLLLGGVMIGSACGQVASSGFYASGDTTTPTRMSMVTYSIFIPCKVIAFQTWGITGLAVTASLYSMNNFVLQVVLMRRKLRKLLLAPPIQGP